MLFEEVNILLQHKKQFVPDLRKAQVPGDFRGKPVIDKNITAEEGKFLSELCPTGAINSSPFYLDLGKCMFCNACQFALPGKIVFTTDFRMATNRRDNLKITPGNANEIQVDNSNIREEIRTVFHRALKLRQVSAGGDNSCEMELNAAGNVNFDMGRYGIEFVASPRHADGMVITGPISRNMAAAVEITWQAIPSPKVLILAGTDAISGGLFKNSNEIDRSFLENKVVDLYIPGNPLHPLTFINGLMDLTGR